MLLGQIDFSFIAELIVDCGRLGLQLREEGFAGSWGDLEVADGFREARLNL